MEDIMKPGHGGLYPRALYEETDKVYIEMGHVTAEKIRPILEKRLKCTIDISRRHWGGVMPHLWKKFQKHGTTMPKEYLKVQIPEASAVSHYHMGKLGLEALRSFDGHLVIGSIQFRGSRIIRWDCGYGYIEADNDPVIGPERLREILDEAVQSANQALIELNYRLVLAGEKPV